MASNNNKQEGIPLGTAESNTEAELASFRAQWQAEVRQRAAGVAPGASTANSTTQTQASESSQTKHNNQQHHKPRQYPGYAIGSSSSTSSNNAPPHSTSTVIEDPTAPDPYAAITFDGTQAEHEREKALLERRRRRSSKLASGERVLNDSNRDDGLTALEYFEHALETEGSGKLGPSLDLYRKAYRMDPKVDEKYRQKYFPKGGKQQLQQQQQQQPVTPQPAKAPAGSEAVKPAVAAPTVKADVISPLVASFSQFRITPTKLPSVGGSKGSQPPLPPSTAPSTSPQDTQQIHSSTATVNDDDDNAPRAFSLLAGLPHELLLHTLHYAAYTDLAVLSKLAQVCKSLAFTVATEETLWKEACLHPKWGFANQVYDFKCSVTWEPLSRPSSPLPDPPISLPDPSNLTLPDLASLTITDVQAEDTEQPDSLLPPLLPPESIPALLPHYHNSYKLLYSSYPRIRYNGIYISTCNYARPGAHQAAAAATNHPSHTSHHNQQQHQQRINGSSLSPIHIVTYYRYIRFYPDGTALTLLSLHEPIEVVYLFVKENVPAATAGQGERGGRRRGGGPAAAATVGTSTTSTTTTTATTTTSSSSSNTTATATANPATTPWLKDLRKARWRILPPFPSNYPSQPTTTPAQPPPALVTLETEGIPADRFEFRMTLELASVGRRQRANRLAWKRYVAWNRVSGDEAEFGLRHDRPFFWSRVGGYGV